MRGKSRIILAEKLWTESKDKQELKQRISLYMSKNYADYRVLEIHKHYAICDTGR